MQAETAEMTRCFYHQQLALAKAVSRHQISSMRTVVIGTRGSALALAQTTLIKEALEKCHPKIRFQIQIIKTTGDKLQKEPRYEVNPIFGIIPIPDEEPDKPLPKKLPKGLFTKELETALIRSKIDVAVHSLKDLPTEALGGLVVAAIPQREDARDLLISREGWTLDQLPHAAVIATGSPRRRSEILRLRPDLVFEDIRGNIDTRLRKLESKPHWAALVLAKAGFQRLRPDLGSLKMSDIPLPDLLPAPGQGALALQCRAADTEVGEIVFRLNHHASRCCAETERAFLSGLGGGCQMPLGTLAEYREGTVSFRARLYKAPGEKASEFSGKWKSDEAPKLSRDLASLHAQSSEVLKQAID